ncbi:MAG: hypothetical protein Q9209_005614 [Squamulea sp. 1 TL-2023]
MAESCATNHRHRKHDEESSSRNAYRDEDEKPLPPPPPPPQLPLLPIKQEVSTAHLKGLIDGCVDNAS